MDKSQVIALLGGPDRAERWQGKDRWTWVYKKSTGPELLDVHFQEGYVVYVGAPPQPKVSAEEQDKINEEINRKADIDERAAIQADTQAKMSRAYRIQHSDDAAAPAEEKHVPEFEPIQ